MSVLTIAEDDYKYGVGVLTIRVESVAETSDPQWLTVRGTQLKWDGSDYQPREVQVRASALPRTRKPRTAP